MNTPKTPETHTIAAQGPGESTLAVESWRLGDRFAHRFVWTAEGQTSLLLTSLEGDSDDSWPLSPPLQQISRQSLENDAILFGVGMAGPNHWSASMRARSGDQPEAGLLIEMACLIRQAAGVPQLGCRYRTASDAWIQADAKKNRWVWRNRYASVSTRWQLYLQGLEGTSIQQDADQLLIRPARIATGSEATEWGFRLAFDVDG